MSIFTRLRQPRTPDRSTAAQDPTTDGGPQATPVDDATTGDATLDDATTGDATTGNATVDDATTGNATTGSATGDDAADGDPTAGGTATLGARRRGWRTGAAWVVTALACLFVFFALVGPNQLSLLTPREFIRVPVEGLLGVALVLVLPPRVRRVAAVLLGVVLGLLTLIKVVDMGFYEVLDRPFNLVLDWILFGDAVDFLNRSLGRAGAVLAVVVAIAVVIAVIVFMTLSVLRLSAIVARHRTGTIRAVVGLGVVWVLCAVLGLQILPGAPVASRSAAALVYDRAGQVRTGLRDQRAFLAEASHDAFANTPDDQLLTALRGKDVMVTFVESYGVVALEDPQVNAILDAGTAQLNAAGYASRSALLTSPTFGGGSWLAQSTLLSGLWIDNQQRYNDLVTSDRLSLNAAFHRADWRTVGVEPAITRAWPEGNYYGFDQLYTSQNTTYRGPRFNFSSMPDQYTLSAFQQSERAKPGHTPVMADIALLSSHTPWSPLPRMVDWNSVGDGSVYDGMPKQGQQPSVVWRDRAGIRAAYMQSIQYTLSTLISYVKTYGDDNLVLVFLGDHQPAPIVSGDGASRNVPITIVARDPSVLDRISGWGWQDGLKPGPQSPVWRMDQFRDRFLSAFGPQARPTPSPSQTTR